MEDFISGIYRYSCIIDELEEFVGLSDAGRVSAARDLYNKATGDLEKMLPFIAGTNTPAANLIQSIALEIKDVYDDMSHTTGLVSGRLVPALYEYMDSIGRIDVMEGNYRLISTDSGFLTVMDDGTGNYLHDVHNPMREAYRLIDARYTPDMESFLIFGCGLGYTAYQVYHQSDGAVKIYLFEDNETMLGYAHSYGVLSLIPKDNIEIIYDHDAGALASAFLKKLKGMPDAGMLFAPDKRSCYDGACEGELNRVLINHDFELETNRLYTINMWKNKKLSYIPFEAARKRFKYDEWVIISAGPSFDESISFLKESNVGKGLIAVNTVLRRLLNEGIEPDVVVAADPSLSLEKHLEGIEDKTKDILLIGDRVLSWKFASLYKGDICLVRTGAGAGLGQGFLTEEPVWDISGTVACLGIEAAVNFGASKIWLVGQDLAYPGGLHYAGGMPHSEVPDGKAHERTDGSSLRVLSVDGQMVDTCEAFIWFKKAIEFQIKKYRNVDFINMSGHGALIEGARCD